MRKHRHFNWTFALTAGMAVGMMPVGAAQAVDTQIQTDNTLSGITALNINAPGSATTYPITEANGKAAGNNLFYSFSNFNVGASDTAHFNLNSANLSNVVSRVTGGSESIIDGGLKMTNAGSSPSFFFINPAGITFGAGASVDVPGSFYASTASSLQFADGYKYNADGSNTSNLSSASPESFGFLGDETGAINIGSAGSGPTLTFKPGTDAAFVGNSIAIDSATITNSETITTGMTAAGVDLQLLATGAAPADVELDVLPSQATGGGLTIQNAFIDVSGNGSGRIAVRAGDISATDSALFADNRGDVSMTEGDGIDVRANSLNAGHSFWTNVTYAAGNGGSVNVAIDQKLTLTDNAAISSNAWGIGDSSDMTIHAGQLEIDGKDNAKVTGIITGAVINSAGNAGDLTVTVDGDLTIASGGKISSSTAGTGNAGSVTVNAGQVDIDNSDGSTLVTGITSNARVSTGNAGSVAVTADGLLSIVDGGVISSSTAGTGDAGAVTIDAGQLEIDGKGSTGNTEFTGIASEAETGSSGKAGSVTVTADTLNIADGGAISSSTFGPGDAGTVTVDAGQLDIDGKNSAGNTVFTGISSSAESGSDGAAGSVTVTVDGNLQMLDGGEISTSTEGQGDAGDIVLTVGSMDLSGSIISSKSTSTAIDAGSAGSITLASSAGDIILTGMTIDTSILGGLADTVADIEINSGGLLSATDSTITAATEGGGDEVNAISAPTAGTLTLTAADSISLSNSTLISKSTSSAATAGSAGNIELNASSDISLNNTGISTEIHGGIAGDNGNQGNISLAADGQITVTGADGEITASTSGDADAGDISLGGLTGGDAQSISLAQGRIMSENNGGGAGKAGTVLLSTSGDANISDQFSIKTNTNGNGAAGDIGIQSSSGSITIDNATITSDSLDAGSGIAGNIDIGAAETLTVDNISTIATNTYNSGNAGNIGLTAGSMDLSNSFILSSSNLADIGAGSAGAITLATDAGDIALTGMNIDTSIKSGLTGTMADIEINSDGSLTITDSTISASTAGPGDAVNAIKAPTAGTLTLTAAGNVSLDNSVVTSSTEGSGDAGDISVQSSAGNIFLNAAAIESSSSAEEISADAGEIDLSAAGELTVGNNSTIATDTYNSGNAGNISLTADSISLDSSKLKSESISDSTAAGSAGNIMLSAPSAINMANTEISTEIRGGIAGDNGNQGDIGLATDGQIIVAGAGSEITASAFGDADAGNITLGGLTGNTAQSIGLSQGSILGESGSGAGNAGTVQISASGGVSVADGFSIQTGTAGSGDAGKIAINASGPLTVANASTIVTNTTSTGNAGSIVFTANSMDLSGSAITSRSASSAGSAGAAGSITLHTGIGGSIVLSAMDIDTSINGGLAGSVADIKIDSGASLLLNGSTINAATSGSGDTANAIRAPTAGTITLSAADSIGLTGSTLSSESISDSAAAGSAGNIMLSAPNAINVANTEISTEIRGGIAGDNGNQGDIGLATDGQIIVAGAGSEITASAFGDADAGNITLGGLTGNTAQSIGLFQGSILGESGSGGGNAGTVQISASGGVSVADGFSIQTGTAGGGNAGDISINSSSGDITLDAATIASDSSGSGGDAGKIAINASGALTVANASTIATNTTSTGTAGSIVFTADSMDLSGSAISSRSASPAGSAGAAGSITLHTGIGGSIVLSAMDIDTSINGGLAGSVADIKIDSGASLLLNGSTINAATSGSGDTANAIRAPTAGTITLTAVGDIGMDSSTLSSNTAGSGEAGDINLAAAGMNLSGSTISSNSISTANSAGAAGTIMLETSPGGGITLSAMNIDTSLRGGLDGDVANITVNSGESLTVNNSTINAATAGLGDAVNALRASTAGTIQLVAADSINLGGSTLSSQSTSDSKTAGSAGNIILTAPNVINVSNTHITTEISGGPKVDNGNQGNISFDTNGRIAVTGGNSTITASTSGDADAGNIILGGLTGNPALSISLAQGSIRSESNGGAGRAGEVQLSASGDITITGGFSVATSTAGSGGAGDISIHSSAGTITLDAVTVESSSSATGNGGSAGIIGIAAAGALTVGNHSTIATNTASSGMAGNISLTAAGMDLSASTISSNSASTAIDAGSAGSITLDTVAAGGDISLDGMSIDTSILGGLTGNVANIGILGGGSLTVDNSTITASSAGGVAAGSIELSTAGQLRLSGGAVTASAHGQGNAGNVTLDAGGLDLANTTISSNSDSTATDAGHAGSVALLSDTNIELTAVNVSTDVDGGQKGGGQGNITVSAANGDIALAQASSITATASGDTDAGTVAVSAGKDLQLLDQSYLSTDTGGAGDAGEITVSTDNIAINPGSYISSSTQGQGAAGSIAIQAGNDLTIQGMGGIPVDRLGRYVATDFTGIRSSASSGSGGQSGTIDITAGHEINLDNGAQISISNDAIVAAPSLLQPTAINIAAPSLYLTDSQIVADSGGNVDAGDITINFEDRLYLDPSAISTVANAGNGGDITINGGNIIYLQDSEIITSVLGASGNGGDINISADYLIMDTGFIQANTAAEGASGGVVNINVDALIPNGGLLYIGGDTPYTFQPYSGINVIQAAAPGGVSGAINVANPQLNLSGTLANLTVPLLDSNALNRNMCAVGEDSSLTKTGKGGPRRRAGDALVTTKF